MKKNSSFLIIFILVTNFIFAQDAKPSFTFCQQSSDFETTWKDFSKCKTELTPIDKETKILSFTLSILAVENGDTIWVDRPNVGNVFDDETKATLNHLFNAGKMANQLLIDDVIVVENKKERKVQGLKINIK